MPAAGEWDDAATAAAEQRNKGPTLTAQLRGVKDDFAGDGDKRIRIKQGHALYAKQEATAAWEVRGYIFFRLVAEERLLR